MPPSRLHPSAAPSVSRRSSHKKARKAQKRFLYLLLCFLCFFVAIFLQQPPTVRCIDYRATQKGRGRLELVTSELTAPGPKLLLVKAMKSTGRHSENSGYLVILLLVVGLTAFSHS